MKVIYSHEKLKKKKTQNFKGLIDSLIQKEFSKCPVQNITTLASDIFTISC